MSSRPSSVVLAACASWSSPLRGLSRLAIFWRVDPPPTGPSQPVSSCYRRVLPCPARLDLLGPRCRPLLLSSLALVIVRRLLSVSLGGQSHSIAYYYYTCTVPVFRAGLEGVYSSVPTIAGKRPNEGQAH
ncbi:hypothetical protein PR003_g26286 [Phytophthora rubi]|uniref:Uncharacterized protein n=1 Tax=Phytophthora rubi TaxID=129364 RepID=A0A6A4C974_9STRA|nr:hypothetical protein PR003_g26286 [Phytophthora rubi]